MKSLVDGFWQLLERVVRVALSRRAALLMVVAGLGMLVLKWQKLAPWTWSLGPGLLLVGGSITVVKLPFFSKMLKAIIDPLVKVDLNETRRFHEDQLNRYDPHILEHDQKGEVYFSQLHELGPGICRSMASAMRLISAKRTSDSRNEPSLAFLVEKVTARPTAEARWRLTVYASISNPGAGRVVLDDFHAHVFFSCRITIPHPASIYEWRSRIWIELKEDNSMIKDKVIEVPAHESVPLAIELEISRLAEEPVGLANGGLRPKYREDGAIPDFQSAIPDRGYMLTIFGLYVDYLTSSDGVPVRIRIPSDSVCMFHDDVGRLLTYYQRGSPDLAGADGSFAPPDWTRGLEASGGATALAINAMTLENFKTKHAGDPYFGMIARIAERCLRSHLASEFILN